MMGLADMAMRMAEMRVCYRSRTPRRNLRGFWSRYGTKPTPRHEVNPKLHPIAVAYYRICDRIARGEKP